MKILRELVKKTRKHHPSLPQSFSLSFSLIWFISFGLLFLVFSLRVLKMKNILQYETEEKNCSPLYLIPK